MTAHLDPLIAIRPPPSTIVSTFGTLKIHGNRKQWNLHIYCTRTDNNHTQSTAVVSDDDTVVIYLILIQSTFTYEKWVGIEILFQIQQKAQQDFRFQLFFRYNFTLFSYKP